MVVWWVPSTKHAAGEYPMYVYAVLLIFSALHQVCTQLHTYSMVQCVGVWPDVAFCAQLQGAEQSVHVHFAMVQSGF